MRNTIRPLSLLFCLLFLVQFVSPEEKKASYKSRFSLKLTGGAGYSAIGDMNRHLESINNVESRDYWSDGEITALNNWGYEFDLELMMKLSPKFSIGLGTSTPFRRTNESAIIFTQQEVPGLGYQKIKMEYRPEIKLSSPIKLNLYYSWLYTRRFKANIMVGIGYYPGTILEHIKETRYAFLYWLGNSISWNTRDWNAKGRFPFGINGGIGLEYFLNDELSLVVDIGGKFARMGKLKASQETRQDTITIKHSGFLYYCIYYDEMIGGKYELLYVSEIDEKGNADFRKAILDLSGFSLKMGIKINLF